MSCQTTVGVNPWVVHRNKEVYGEDVEAFRPDRWLEENNGDMRKLGVHPRTIQQVH